MILTGFLQCCLIAAVIFFVLEECVNNYMSICARVNTLCTLYIQSARSQFTFSSALFDTHEQCSGFLHIMHKKTCEWVDNDKNNNVITGFCD